MALQLGALRDALIEAGATQAVASKAAEEVAGYDNRLHKIEADLVLVKWMVGACGAGIMSIIVGVLVLLLRTRGLGG